jgi:hypothetical protein
MKEKSLMKEQVDEMFFRWYKGEKVDSLLKEFHIDRIPNCSFAKHFPPIFCEMSCPYCFEDLYAFRSDSNYYKKSQVLYDISTAHCINCGHDTRKANCSCEGCISKRKENETALAEQEAERLHQRSLHLERLYNNIVPVNFEEMELIELIYLYAMGHQSTCEDITLISPFSTSEAPFTPSEDWDRECIQSLLKYIAPLCDDEKLLKIDENGSASWNGHKVFYKIKIKGIDETDYLESLLNYIKNKLKVSSISENFDFISLFERIMVYECIDYLAYMRGTLGLPHEVGTKTSALFKKLLQNWRIDQVYTIIWSRCKDALTYKVQNGLPKQHASNLIISLIDKYVDKVIQNNWEIKSYYRDSTKKQSAMSYVLFNKILELGGTGVEYNFQDVLTKLREFCNSEQLENVELNI